MLKTIRKFEADQQIQILEIDRHRVSLCENFVCDLDCLKSVLVDRQKTMEFLTRMGGNLLYGIDVNSVHLEDWLRAQREKHEEFVVQSVTSMLHRWNPEERLRVISHIQELAPYDESVATLQAETLLQLNKKSTAIFYLEKFVSRLDKDLGAEPSYAVRDLANKLSSKLMPEPKVERPDNKNLAGEAFDGEILPRLIVLPPDFSQKTKNSLGARITRAFIKELTFALAGSRSFEVYAPQTAEGWKPQVTEHRPPKFIVSFEWPEASSNQNMIRISMSDGETGRIYFAESLKLSPLKRAELIGEIAHAISKKIDAEAKSEMFDRFRISRKSNAGLLYLIGVTQYRPFDLKSIRSARKLFRAVSQKNPQYVLARRMLANTYIREWFLLARNENELLDLAVGASNSLIDIDPLFSGGYWEKGSSFLYLHKIEEALELLDKATNFAPHNADLLADTADAMVHACRFSEADQLIQKACDLNPDSPDEYHLIRAAALFFMGQYKKSLTELKLVKNWAMGSRLKAACFAQLGDIEQAKKNKDKYTLEYPDFRVENWGRLVPLADGEFTKFYQGSLRLAGFR